MRLDELDWEDDAWSHSHTRCVWDMPITDGYVDIIPSQSGYHIYHHVRPGGLVAEWHRIDALTAQCILNHLTQEGNDEIG